MSDFTRVEGQGQPGIPAVPARLHGVFAAVNGRILVAFQHDNGKMIVPVALDAQSARFLADGLQQMIAEQAARVAAN